MFGRTEVGRLADPVMEEILIEFKNGAERFGFMEDEHAERIVTAAVSFSGNAKLVASIFGIFVSETDLQMSSSMQVGHKNPSAADVGSPKAFTSPEITRER